MKNCPKCGADKELSEFYRDRSRKDGLRCWCKLCASVSHKEWALENKDKTTELYKKWSNTKEGKEHIRRSDKKYNDANKDKNKARNDAGYAVRCGKLTPQPCETCGKLKVQKHHEDYSRPLDVEWLCRKCHRNKGTKNE